MYISSAKWLKHALLMTEGRNT